MQNGSRDPAGADLAYAASYAGFVGSAVVALFFLVRDAVMGTPLLTPSLLATALFEGGVASGGASIRLEGVALVSLVHVTLFSSVGAAFAYLVHRVEPLLAHPVAMGVGLFAVLGSGIVSLDVLMAPGLIAAIGPVAVTVGNAMASVAMAVFYRSAFNRSAVPAEARRR